LSQDATDLNPLIRALAVRTMGCIRVDKISEYLCDPLRKSLKVRHPQRHRVVLRRART
jgi:AP-1 complex subunit beta-1